MESFMLRAIELAKRGAGNVAPNPMVGCVIVHNDSIIGEGWHRKYGGPHAEVHAIQNVKDQECLQSSTLFVTLEPCSHFGKTPPCADLIISSQIPRVYIANLDPNPLVAGKGIEKLRASGIEVIVGLRENEAAWMNRRFLTFMQKGRPYIRLKWAMSSDGFMDKLRAADEKGSFRISGDEARRISHRWRTEESAILIGAQTAIVDDPDLTARFWPGKSPIRVLLDPSGRVPKSSKIFSNQAPTLVYTSVIQSPDKEGIEVINIPQKDYLQNVLIDLHKRKVLSLLVEGGAKTLQSFIDQELWDEVLVFKSSEPLTQGLKAPEFPDGIKSTEQVGGDQLIRIAKS